MTNQVVPSNPRFSPKKICKPTHTRSARKEVVRSPPTSPCSSAYFFRLSTVSKNRRSCTRQLFHLSEARSLKLAEEIETMTENLPQIQTKSEEFGFDFHRGEPIANNGKFDWQLVTPPSPGHAACSAEEHPWSASCEAPAVAVAVADSVEEVLV